MKRFTLLTLGILASVAFGAPAPRHYVYLFAYDDGEQTPHKTHTWATFVEMTGEATVKSHTISWLPRSGKVQVIALGPERGRNYSLEETFALATRNEWLLGQWGPYAVTPELYRLSVEHKKWLDSGDVWYRVLDTPNRVFKALDPESESGPAAVMCSHAVADVVRPVDPKGFLLTGTTSGFAATAKVAWHLTDWYTRSTQDPRYLVAVPAADKAAMDAALGLARYAIRRFPLEQKNNNYCATLEDCRRVAGTLSLGN